MYLNRVHIENNGPIKMLNLDIPTKADGTPKPLILVGENGTGKTNFLSIVADAIIEAAAKHYIDVVSNGGGLNRPYFRLLGGSTMSAGSIGTCTLLQFLHNGQDYFYREKAGSIEPKEVSQRLNKEMKTYANWEKDSPPEKVCSISDEQAKGVFESGVYLFFPATRAENPHWLNTDSITSEPFNFTPHITKKLHKPIYVEHGLDKLKQWMLCLLIDKRMDVILDREPFPQNASNIQQPKFLADWDSYTQLSIPSELIWGEMNSILSIILNSDAARFVWAGRRGKLQYDYGPSSLPLPLESLSTGQATLLTIFGTLLRYGDGTTVPLPLRPETVSGICVIDEVDAHMHVDLQFRALPKLIRKFPKIQFILSSHSPLFILGAEKEFGSEGISIFEMPNGTPIQAEAYSEFGHAFQKFQDTKSFDKAIHDAVAKIENKALVFLEGETDQLYFNTAVDLINPLLKDRVEFKWIGSSVNGKQAINTGKDALNHAARLLKAHPEVIQRPILFLYDNDTNKQPEDFGRVKIRAIPSNPIQLKIKKGIESYLPSLVFTDDMYNNENIDDGNGKELSMRTLNKMCLCEKLCKERNPQIFESFRPLLQMITEIADQFSQSSAIGSST